MNRITNRIMNRRIMNRKIMNRKAASGEIRNRKMIHRKTAAVLCVIALCIILPRAKTTAAAGEPGQFRSRGVICYQDAGGQQIILDAGDLEKLFQCAAEGKSGLSGALSGVGTKLIQKDTGYFYTREPKEESSIDIIQSPHEMQSVDFDLLLQALAESQTLPDGYEETYVLASSDNLTLGRSAWSDGSLLRGNNHDLTQHYMKGWMEGSGNTEYEAIYDGEGRWIGYRAKQV